MQQTKELKCEGIRGGYFQGRAGFSRGAPKLPSTRRIIGVGVERADIDGVAVYRIFNRAIARQPLPKHISTDHEPLLRSHRWLANLRVLEIDEIKTVPNVPVSHPFVEWLIGTVRRELLDRTFVWSALDLERKLQEFRGYYNGGPHCAIPGLAKNTTICIIPG